MRKQLVAVLLSFALCASASAAQFAFAVFGDMPYNAAEELELASIIDEMNREDFAFVMHVGDLKHSEAECSNELFARRRESFGKSKHAFVFIPGDNDWADCKRSTQSPREPLDSLAKLRDLFFAKDSTLGRRPLQTVTQAGRGYPEHLRWTVQNVLFATLNVPGPDNNRSLMPKESRSRTPAVIEWIREAFHIARSRNLPGLVLALHADMWSRRTAYRDILGTLSEEALRYRGEVLVVHGDTHWYRFDRPLIDPRSGSRIENVTRLEVFGSPLVDWTRVTVLLDNGRVRFMPVSGRRVGAGAQPASAEK